MAKTNKPEESKMDLNKLKKRRISRQIKMADLVPFPAEPSRKYEEEQDFKGDPTQVDEENQHAIDQILGLLKSDEAPEAPIDNIDEGDLDGFQLLAKRKKDRLAFLEELYQDDSEEEDPVKSDNLATDERKVDVISFETDDKDLDAFDAMLGKKGKSEEEQEDEWLSLASKRKNRMDKISKI